MTGSPTGGPRSARPTWNRNLPCLRSACAYWPVEHWITGDPTVGLPRAKLPSNRTRSRSRTAIADLLARPKIALRERTLWALLYESAAHAHEVLLLLDVTDLDRPNRSRGGTPQGSGAVDEITWQTRTARPLARHLAGRTRGPVFLTDRTVRVTLAAAELFTQATGGWTLHDLRHSALNPRRRRRHAPPMLMTKSGHTSICTLARYSRPSVDAVARWQDQRDPTGHRPGPR